MAVAGAVGAAVAAGVLEGDDDAGGEIRLEPIGAPVPDAFGPDVDRGGGRAIAIALPQLPEHEQAIASLLSGRRARGDAVGLFGGTRDEAVCDLDQLVAFLTDPANDEQARAWAGVLGIAVGDIEQHLDGLTAVRLRSDTRVTNHGFRDGDALAVQSILQAGTGVLVDASGAPRVKCSCGNPLLDPAPPRSDDAGFALDLEALASNPEDAWEGFDPAAVVSVEPAAEQDELVLLDLDDATLFSRAIGSNGATDADVRDLAEKCRELDASPSCAADDDGADEQADGGSFCEEPLRGAFRRLYSSTVPEDPGEQLNSVDRVEVDGFGQQLLDALEGGASPPAAIADDIEVVVAWVEEVMAGTETTFPPGVEEAFDRLFEFSAEAC